MNRWSKGFLVALRIVVGWHFLYEGLWKIDSDTGSTSYATSWYTLQSSTTRLQDYLDESGADPQLEPALARIDAWYNDIVNGFSARGKSLTDEQKARLTDVRDKMKAAAAASARRGWSADPIVNFEWPYLRDEVLKIAAEPEGDRFTSLSYLQGAAGPFRSLYRGLVSDVAGLDRLTVAAVQAAIDERFGVILRHYSSSKHPFTASQQQRLTGVRDSLKTAVSTALTAPGFQARLEDYKLMLKRASLDLSRTHAPFTNERVTQDRQKLDAIAGELLTLVKEPLAELDVQAEMIATQEQLSSGPLPRPADQSSWIDRTIEVALIAIGLCLMLGLFTPVAALAAAGQLALFYFASPPWPGLPASTLGGHYLYVDRNLIEMAAALVVAATGTGHWAGLDAYLDRYLWKKPDPIVDAAVDTREVGTVRS